MVAVGFNRFQPKDRKGNGSASRSDARLFRWETRRDFMRRYALLLIVRGLKPAAAVKCRSAAWLLFHPATGRARNDAPRAMPCQATRWEMRFTAAHAGMPHGDVTIGGWSSAQPFRLRPCPVSNLPRVAV